MIDWLLTPDYFDSRSVSPSLTQFLHFIVKPVVIQNSSLEIALKIMYAHVESRWFLSWSYRTHLFFAVWADATSSSRMEPKCPHPLLLVYLISLIGRSLISIASFITVFWARNSIWSTEAKEVLVAPWPVFAGLLGWISSFPDEANTSHWWGSAYLGKNISVWQSCSGVKNKLV